MIHRTRGFTLIELMIAVAIIGILAAMSIPLFQGNVMKSQVSRAVGELGHYKTPFETALSSSTTAITNEQLGYTPSGLTTGNAATPIATVNPDGSGHLEVTLGGKAHPNVAGTVIRLERSAMGGWNCVIDPSGATNWKPDYKPAGCSVAP